ncbi:MAG: PDZ domain-containing protein [Synergistes sp.]|nr:PDZ domain-containing protein [Synergistes sp.]
MRKFFVFTLILFMLPMPANAYVNFMPGSPDPFSTLPIATYPQTVYVAPDPFYQLSQAIAAQNKAAKEEKKLKEYLAKVNEIVAASADHELEFLITKTNELGIQETIALVQDITFEQGVRLDIQNYNDITEFSYKETHPDFTVNYSYAYKTSTEECRVIVEIPELRISKSAHGRYSEPKPETPPTEIADNNIGMVLSIQKTPEGGFTILEVMPDGPSAVAKIKKGDILIKVDNYDLKEQELDRITAYIEMRHGQKQPVSATVLRENKPLIFQIQL